MDKTKPTVTAEELGGVFATIAQEKGLTVEEARAHLVNGIEKGMSIDTIENTVDAILEVSKSMKDAAGALIEEKTKEYEAEAFEAYATSNAYKTYKSLEVNDPERLKIAADFTNALGAEDALTLLEGSEFKKALQAPISKNDPKYEEKNLARKASDLLGLYVAGVGGVQHNPTNPDEPRVDPITVKACFEKLQKEGLPGIEYVERAINNVMDSTGSGQGSDWVPAQILSRNLYQDVWLALDVAGNFQRFTATGPTFTVPIRTSRTRGFCMNEATAVAHFFATQISGAPIPSYMGTSNVAFHAKKYGVLTFLSDELEQDSVIPVLEATYADLAYGAADGIEDAVINGSRNASLNDLDNQGTDTNRLWANSADAGDGIRLNTGVVDARYMWDGIRKQALTAATVTSSGTIARADFLNTRSKMNKYGVNPDMLFSVISPRTYAKFLAFPEVSTLEKYGLNATIMKGELARLDNIPLIVSPRIYENEDNKGYFTNGTVVGGSSGVSNLTELLVIHKWAYAFADRMVMKIESERQILSQQRAILASMRLDFNKMFKNTEPTEGRLIAITAS